MSAKELDLRKVKKLQQEAEQQIARILWDYYLSTGLLPIGVKVEQKDSNTATEAFHVYNIRIDVTIP